MSVTVVGWDGAPLRSAARRALASATLVVGGRRHLDAVPLPAGVRTVAMGDVGAALEAVGEHVAAGSGPTVVLASGDPCFFGIVRTLRERGLTVEVVPAVSAVAAAYARLGLPWDDALVVSAHGRALRAAVNACRAHPKVAVLTAPDAGPADLGACLRGTDRMLVVAEQLGSREETVTACTPAEAAAGTWRDPNVVLVLDPARAIGARGWRHGAPPRSRGWALAESAYRHRDGMVTKSEVRALALARLAPEVGDLVWDVGSGSGAVAIECARMGAAVVAVERDADACGVVAANAATHGVEVSVVHGSAPEILSGLPDPDAVFVGGGGPAVVAACAARRPARVVVALAAVERVGPTLAALGAGGYPAEGVLLQASRITPLPDGTHRLAATNPVHVMWGVRP